MKAGLISKAWGEGGTKCLGLLHILCHQVPCHMQQQAHIFPRHPFAADISTEILLRALRISFQIQVQVGFGFRNPTPACSLLLLSYLTLPSALESCLFMSFCQEILFHPSRCILLPLLDFLHVGMDCSWGWRMWSLKPINSPWPLYLHGSIPWNSYKQIHWTGQSLPSWSTVLWSCFLSCFVLPGSWKPSSNGHCSQRCFQSLHTCSVLPCL